ncbi:hypothetical protein ACCO45_008088 [Purpureocillium lilacinum]|uniref:Uncharacterized protein n=1 Tax=Purpureocillium lilacinum TaxID=33203 RepID=A0ACC4DM97_PURLI
MATPISGAKARDVPPLSSCLSDCSAVYDNGDIECRPSQMNQGTETSVSSLIFTSLLATALAHSSESQACGAALRPGVPYGGHCSAVDEGDREANFCYLLACPCQGAGHGVPCQPDARPCSGSMRSCTWTMGDAYAQCG